MIYNMRRLIELLIHPYFICIFLLGICLLLLWRGTHKFILKLTVLMIFITLMVVSTDWLPSYMVDSLEDQYTAIVQVDPKVKWVVVLSGGYINWPNIPVNSMLSTASLMRLTEGIRLFKSLPNAQLVLSGGSPSDGAPESERLAQASELFAIPKTKIVIEKSSKNTKEQAEALQAIVHHQPFYLITSAIHMPRAMYWCKIYGLNPIPAPTDFSFFGEGSLIKKIIPKVNNLDYFTKALHEMLGQLWATNSTTIDLNKEVKTV